jgi:hypothetical protein
MLRNHIRKGHMNGASYGRFSYRATWHNILGDLNLRINTCDPFDTTLYYFFSAPCFN